MKSALVALVLLPSAAAAQVSSKDDLDVNCLVIATSLVAPEAIRPEIKASLDLAVAGAIASGIPRDEFVARAISRCAAVPGLSIWGAIRQAAQAE